MRRPSMIVIDGKAYRWRDILQMRREQCAAVEQATQLALFEDLPDDARPVYERTASDRYQQPSLFTRLAEESPFM